MAIRKFTKEEYKVLLDFCVMSEECRQIQVAAHNLYHHRSDLSEQMLEFTFDDLAASMFNLNKAYDAVRPLFRKQEEAA